MKFGALGALGGIGNALNDIGRDEFKAQQHARAEAARAEAIEKQWLKRHQVEQEVAQTSRMQQRNEQQTAIAARQQQVAQTLASLPEGASDLDRARVLTQAGFADEAKLHADLFKAGDMSEHRELTRAAQRETQIERIAAQRARLEATQAKSAGEQDTSNFKAIQAVNELQTLFGTKDAFGEFSLAPENKAKYLMAREQLNRLMGEGIAPAAAVMQAYSIATGQTRITRPEDNVPPKREMGATRPTQPAAGATRPPLSTFRGQ